jgi:hypothetical protein
MVFREGDMPPDSELMKMESKMDSTKARLYFTRCINMRALFPRRRRSWGNLYVNGVVS